MLDANRQPLSSPDLDHELDLFFFCPEEEIRDFGKQYQRLYEEYFPGDTLRYSPLYRLRGELHALRKRCMWFSAMLVSDLIIEGLVKGIYREKSNDNFFSKFYKDYFKETTEFQRFIIRQYRNAQVHSFGLLRSIQVPQRPSKELKSEIESSGVCTRDIRSFDVTLSTDYPEVAKLVPSTESSGDRLTCFLNPKRYLHDLDEAIVGFSRAVREREDYRQKFQCSYPRCNWIIVSQASRE